LGNEESTISIFYFLLVWRALMSGAIHAAPHIVMFFIEGGSRGGKVCASAGRAMSMAALQCHCRA
jgi:hypothetical protein